MLRLQIKWVIHFFGSWIWERVRLFQTIIMIWRIFSIKIQAKIKETKSTTYLMLCCFLFIYIIFAYFELIISSNANYIVSTQSEMHLQRSKIVKMLPIELILRRTHTTGCSSQIISNDSGLFFFQHCKKQLFCISKSFTSAWCATDHQND